ncbi:MAG TPA: helix-turn-helix domain-containing protein [Candidatus Saccharimonadales bacterium]|nr:helix-turn-helix domain-containing protein [Candidatus Saccharimonadales bacterium]
MSLAFLQSFGLTANEIEIYELLVKLGEVPAQEIIRKSKIKRPTIYKSLLTLEKKGLITKRDLRKKIHFRPESPTKLLELAENQFRELERARSNLQAAIPVLGSNYVQSTEQPVVRIYEGREGIKNIYKDTLKEKKLIYAVESLEKFDDDVWKWANEWYLPLRPKMNIHTKVIVSSGRRARLHRTRDIKHFRVTREVPEKLFPFQLEVDVYGDKVAFINYRTDHLLGIVVKHPLIAETMKAWFDLAWDGAEKYSKPARTDKPAKEYM